MNIFDRQDGWLIDLAKKGYIMYKSPLTKLEKERAKKKKIEAIKLYRERTGADLKTAKEEVEKYLFNPNAYDENPYDNGAGTIEVTKKEFHAIFNQSMYDAYTRVSKARDMSFVGATEEYLVALAKYLKSWHSTTILELRRVRKEKAVVKNDETQSDKSNLLQRALNQKRRYTHRDLQSLARNVEKYIGERYSKSNVRLISLGKWDCIMRESEIVFRLPYIVKNPDGSNEELEYKITL